MHPQIETTGLTGLPAERFFRYGTVGLLGAAIYIGTLRSLVDVIGWPPLVGSVVGFLLTFLESYTLNYFWTFRSDQNHTTAFPRFILVSCFGLLLNVGIMYVGVTVFHVNYMMVALIVIVAVAMNNFLLNAYWTFRAKGKFAFASFYRTFPRHL